MKEIKTKKERNSDTFVDSASITKTHFISLEQQPLISNHVMMWDNNKRAKVKKVKRLNWKYEYFFKEKEHCCGSNLPDDRTHSFLFDYE